jgi:hypothetical protein
MVWKILLIIKSLAGIPEFAEPCVVLFKRALSLTISSSKLLKLGTIDWSQAVLCVSSYPVHQRLGGTSLV